MEKTDQQLVHDYLKGDEEAFRELVERHTTATYYFIYRLTKSAPETQDIIQETFVKVWKNIKKYRPQQSFKVWLFTIARNTTIDWQRKRKHVAFSDFDNEEGDNVIVDTLADDEPLAEELFAKAENKKAVQAKLAELSPIYQEILALRYEEELTFEEISDILKKSLNTVKSRHRRALMALRKILDAPK